MHKRVSNRTYVFAIASKPAKQISAVHVPVEQIVQKDHLEERVKANEPDAVETLRIGKKKAIKQLHKCHARYMHCHISDAEKRVTSSVRTSIIFVAAEVERAVSSSKDA